MVDSKKVILKNKNALLSSLKLFMHLALELILKVEYKVNCNLHHIQMDVTSLK